MYWYFLTTAILFYVLTPGVFIRLPAGGSETTVAVTHAVVFATVHILMHKYGLRS